jgi:hypothetical protein
MADEERMRCVFCQKSIELNDQGQTIHTESQVESCKPDKEYPKAYPSFVQTYGGGQVG